MRLITLSKCGFAVLAGLVLATSAYAQAGILEGFKTLAPDAKVVLMPMDVELFSISGGGVLEPQAEWTTRAMNNLKQAFAKREAALKLKFNHMSDAPDESIDDLNRLHGAVGRAIVMHHLGMFKLPTKEGKFDWSLGSSVESVAKKSGADYALFTYVRDSYASSERVATMVVLAMFGIGVIGGMQYGYASLVDLRTGQVVWFNQILRGTGDLREPEKAQETLDALLAKFPAS